MDNKKNVTEMYKITKEDIGNKVVLRFMPNINDLQNFFVSFDMFWHNTRSTKYVSYILKDNKVIPFSYGKRISQYLQGCMRGQFLTVDGRFLKIDDSLLTNDSYSNEFPKYYEFEDGTVTINEPSDFEFKNGNPTSKEKFIIKNAIYVAPFHPFDLKCTKALEITVKETGEFLNLDDIRWIDVEPIFDGENKEYCLALYDCVQPLTNVMEREKTRLLSVDDTILFDEDARIASNNYIRERINQNI